MHKTSLQHCVFICGAGAFGVFFRWLQLQLAFDDAGLCGSSIWNLIVPASILLAAYLFRRRALAFWEQRLFLPREFHAALKNEGLLFSIARWTFGGLMVLGALLLLVTSETDRLVGFLRVLALFGALSGLSFPLLLAEANKPEADTKTWLLRLFSLFPIVFFALWLVYCYQANAINSVIWAFAVEVLTVCASMSAFFRVAGLCYGQAKPRQILFMNQWAAFLCFMALADDRNFGMQLMFFATGLMLTLYHWIMLSNLKERAAKEKAARDEAVPGDGIERL